MLRVVQQTDAAGRMGFIVEAPEPLDRALAWALVNKLLVDAGELSPQVAALVRSAVDLQMPGVKFPPSVIVDLGRVAGTKSEDRS